MYMAAVYGNVNLMGYLPAVQNTPMLIHPEINPVALQLGPLAIHWYGLTYLAAFGLFFFLATLRLRHQPYASITGTGAWSRRDIEDILFWA